MHYVLGKMIRQSAFTLGAVKSGLELGAVFATIATLEIFLMVKP